MFFRAFGSIIRLMNLMDNLLKCHPECHLECQNISFWTFGLA